MVAEQASALDALRANEQASISNDSSFYEPEPKSKIKGNLKKKLKNKALVFILGSIIAFTGAITASQVMLPFSLASNLITQFNTIIDSFKSRDNFLRRSHFRVGEEQIHDLTDGGKYKNPLKTGIFSKKKLNLSRKQLKKMKKYGFEVENKKLYFRSKGKNVEINAENIEHYIKTDPDIQTAYHNSSKTWRGNISGWFDAKVKNTLNRLGTNLRKRYHDWQNSGNETEDFKKFKKITANPVDAESESNLKNKNLVKKENPDGTIDEKWDPDESSSGKIKNSIDPNESKSKADSAIDHELGVASRIANATNLYCGVSNFINGLNLLVSAYHVLEIVNLSSTFLEATDKVKAGHGNKSPLGSYMKTLLTKDKNGKTAIESYGIGTIFGRKNKPKNNDSTILASREGIGALIQKNIGIEYRFDKNKYQQCNKLKTGAGIVSITATVAGILTGGIGNAIKLAVTTVSKNLGKAALKLAIAAFTPAIISKASDLLAQKLGDSLFGKFDFLGEKGGDALAAGGHFYLSENAKSGGQSPADKKRLIAFYRDAVVPTIKEESEIARSKLSPFDLSSEYTFLGSIFHKSLPLLASSNLSISNFSLLTSITKNSLISMLPSAQALTETNFTKTEGECPSLDTIGAIGDAFCNPYYITDTSTINMPMDGEKSENIFIKTYDLGKYKYTKPVSTQSAGCSEYYASSNFKVDPTYILKDCDLGVQTNEEGNPVINPYSKLGAYVNFCGMRSSNLGAIDGNIASWVRHIDFKKGTIDNARRDILENNAVSGIINVIPVLGDLVDIGESIKDMKEENVNWVNGQNCIASDSNSNWDKEIKYYQRYSEDQRFLENSGVIEKANTADVINEYLSLSPLDNSEIGMLSRFSGLPKNQVIATLNYLEYQIALQNYHPDELAPLPKIARYQTLKTNNSTPRDFHEISAKLPNTIIYTPLRHRNFAA